MIRWPDERRLSEAGRRHLAFFRQIGAADELSDDPETWELEATSWTDEFPGRLIWRDERRRERCFSVEDDGSWRFIPWENAPILFPKSDDPLTPLGRKW
jgi:hypothetical protein